jgi:predicted amidophosphoribosyltransferase
MTRKCKRAIPILLLWSRQEQRRFTDTVELLRELAKDLEILLATPKRRAAAAAATRAARAAARAAADQGGAELPRA